MNKKEKYKIDNERFIEDLRNGSDVNELKGGVLYRVLASGDGASPRDARSVVTCHYKGSLISGKVFDSSYERKCPEAFRLCDLIPGFQSALMNMRVGDHWIVYIPSQLGYGSHGDADIPANSTLIFEIELISVM